MRYRGYIGIAVAVLIAAFITGSLVHRGLMADRVIEASNTMASMHAANESELKNRAGSEMVSLVQSYYHDYLDLDLESGGITRDTGENQEGYYALRSGKMLQFSEKFVILNSKPERYRVRIMTYSHSGEYVECREFGKPFSVVTPDPQEYYRVTIIPAEGAKSYWNEQDAFGWVKVSNYADFDSQIVEPKDGELTLAHMGYYHNDIFHRNTLDAIHWSWILGYAGAELDVNRASDGTPVISHDKVVKAADGKEYDLSKMTGDEIRKTKFWKDDAVMPTLWEVLDDAEKYEYTVLLDIKQALTDDNMKKLAERVKKSEFLQQHVIYGSVHAGVLQEVRNNIPKATVLFIGSDAPKVKDLKSGKDDYATLRKLVKEKDAVTMVRISPELAESLAYVKEVKSLGYEVVMDNVKAPALIKQFMPECRYFISDNVGTYAMIKKKF
jgi:glycerophosphoryl diester phosphodiesterase